MIPGWITEETRCGQCGKPMVVLLGMGARGMFRVDTMVQLDRQGVLHGSFQCGACDRYYCWDCSDMDRTCKCGQQEWRERNYMDPAAARQLAAQASVQRRVHGDPFRRAPFTLRHPGLGLSIALLWYVLETYGLLTGQVTPHPDRKALWYGLSLLPAVVVLWGARKLGLPTLVAGLLALTGPAVLTWAFWMS